MSTCLCASATLELLFLPVKTSHVFQLLYMNAVQTTPLQLSNAKRLIMANFLFPSRIANHQRSIYSYMLNGNAIEPWQLPATWTDFCFLHLHLLALFSLVACLFPLMKVNNDRKNWEQTECLMSPWPVELCFKVMEVIFRRDGAYVMQQNKQIKPSV